MRRYGSLDGKKQDVMSEAIMKLGELGIIFCAASGNESSDIDRDVVYPASYNPQYNYSWSFTQGG